MSNHLRERITTLQHHLNRLDPRRNVDKLSLILQLFTNVDVASHSTVADWLTPAFGWSISREMVHNTMRKMPCPIKILVSADGRPFLTCYSTMGESTSDASKSSDYLLVPFTSEDGSCEGVISSSIHEGDLIRLRCFSSVIWVVFTILQKENKIILAVNNRDQSVGTPKLGSSGILSEEKRTSYPSDFLGAIVWKEMLAGEASNRPEEYYQISTNGLNISKDLSNSTPSKSCVLQMPFTPWNSVLESILFLVKEESLYSKDLSIKMKKSSSSSSFSMKKSVYSDSPPASTSRASPPMVREKSASAFIEKYVSEGYHAQAQMWIRKAEDIREARRLLWTSDPFSCCLSSCRDRWILTCRALRSLCRGGGDLLDDFYRWTKMAGLEGLERSKSCKSLWASLRPLTTADLPCVMQARVYARACAHLNNQRTEGEIEGENDCSGRLSYRNIEAQCRVDPTLNSFMSAASTALSDHSLYFLSSVHDQQSPGIAHHPPGAVYLPAAVYESTLSCSVSSDDPEVMKSCTLDDVIQRVSEDGVGIALDIVTPSKLVRTTEIVACISPGNVLLLPIIPIDCPDSWEVRASNERSSSPSSSISTLSLTTKTSRSGSFTWHRVVSVDLFHARVRVSPCPPPPYCWNRHVTLPSVWTPISSLWATTICQFIPNKTPEWAATIEYVIYIAPLPSRVASLSALASLPRKDTTYSESSTLRSTVRRKIK